MTFPVGGRDALRSGGVGARRGRHRAGIALLVLAIFAVGEESVAFAQACCVGASGLTPGWLANHEQWLVGAQLRVSEMHGAYPTRGSFYAPPVSRDTRIESSFFASVRLVPRGQVSVFAPLVTTRRSADVVEAKTAIGDISLAARYDLVRSGESRLPGVAVIAGIVAPTGTPSDRGSGLLAADVTGIGAWEGNAGVSVEQVHARVIFHGTALLGLRAPRDVLGVTQQLGPRALFLVAGGYVFDGDVVVLGTVTHTSDGDATVGGLDAYGSGFRATQLAMLVVTPISDTVRLRTSAFTDVPPLGNNRPAFGGTSISLMKSWF